LPILIFLVVYLGNGIFFECIRPIEGAMGFYIMSVVVAFGVALIAAFFQNRTLSFDEKIHLCAQGIGDDNITIMLFIFLLSGAFSGIAGEAGGAVSTANMLLNIIPPRFAEMGLFIIACLISMAMGTSVGTITVLVPIATTVAQNGGLSLPMCVGTVVGGAMFGDNLSFISDTTIAATKTQGVQMADKFRTNIKIALPSAILTLLVILFLSLNSEAASMGNFDFDPILAAPYFAVLILALLGVNVFAVLLIGVVLYLAAGFLFGSLDYVGALSAMGSGTAGMFETMIVTVLVASISALMKEGGGFAAILEFIKKRATGKKGGMAGIGLLTAFLDIATANNTVAIVIAAPIAKEISEEYGVSGRVTASLLDTCSCIAQGIIPYGAQLLIASSLAGISSIEIIPWLLYPFILMIFVVVSIIRAKQ
jgi:Na+/H+ antiporter NhaC